MMNIRMNATALSMAATVRLWVVSFLIIFLPGRLPHSNKDWKALFSLAETGKTNENAPCHSLH